MEAPPEQTAHALAPSPSPEPLPGVRGASPRHAGGRGTLALACVSLIVSSAVSAGAIYLYDHLWAQKVVMADVPAYVEALRQGTAAGLVPGETQDRELRRLQAVLDAVPGRLVVISRDVVLRNADEVPLPAPDFFHQASLSGDSSPTAQAGAPSLASP